MCIQQVLTLIKEFKNKGENICLLEEQEINKDSADLLRQYGFDVCRIFLPYEKNEWVICW